MRNITIPESFILIQVIYVKGLVQGADNKNHYVLQMAYKGFHSVIPGIKETGRIHLMKSIKPLFNSLVVSSKCQASSSTS